ncbi:MAG: hypothetical protein ACREN2_06610 [Candidatus Dormibacteria bacterium]
MKWKRLIIGLAGAGALASCGTAPQLTTPTTAPAVSAPAARAMAAPAPKAAVELTIQVELEPNDHAHRNYCAEGAIAVLLSTWSSALPSLDDIGVSAHVDENRGTKGADAARAINEYLGQITGTTSSPYSTTYVTSPASLKSLLETDLSGLGNLAAAGHGSPVLVRVRTATLPGWNGYQASHVVAVFGYDFTPGNPDGDTVTYAESAGSVAGYSGPQVQTISLAALWAATQTTTTFGPLHDPWTVVA